MVWQQFISSITKPIRWPLFIVYLLADIIGWSLVLVLEETKMMLPSTMTCLSQDKPTPQEVPGVNLVQQACIKISWALTEGLGKYSGKYQCVFVKFLNSFSRHLPVALFLLVVSPTVDHYCRWSFNWTWNSCFYILM